MLLDEQCKSGDVTYLPKGALSHSGVQVMAFHFTAFFLGHQLAEGTIAADSKPLARCISLETGMQVRCFQRSCRFCEWSVKEVGVIGSHDGVIYLAC